MTTFVRYGAYFLTVFLFMFFGKLSVMAGGLFVLAGLINIGLKYGLWLNLFVNRLLLRIQTDDVFAERVKKGATSFGFWTIDSFTLIPAYLYLLLLVAFPVWWYGHNAGVAIPAGLEEGVAFTPITAFMLVFLETMLKLLVPAIKITGANITTTEVPYESLATMHVHVFIGIALVFFVAWAFTTWDDRIRVINDVPTNGRGEEAGWQSWINWFFRNLMVRLGLPLLLAFITLRTGVWDKTIVPIKSNDAAIVLHEMIGLHTKEYDQLITRLRKQKMPDTPLGNEVAELANPTAPVTYGPATRQTPTPSYAPTYSPSGSKSSKGGSGIGGWLMWIVILVLAGGLLFWLKKKGKLSGVKMPAIKKPSFGFKMPSFRRSKKEATEQEKAIAAAQLLEHPESLDAQVVSSNIDILEEFLRGDRDEQTVAILRRIIANAKPYANQDSASQDDSQSHEADVYTDQSDMAAMQAAVTYLQNALRGGADPAEVERNIAFIAGNIQNFPTYEEFLNNLIAGVRQHYPELRPV